ncbi:transposase [Streptococcus massiliensis]|uniref:Transposase n=1 Tax=Streptococcus massiliensis TaxID=313439 RepID=A0A380KQC5_9STRE|nr:transposase [Streptococcus massiliensis]
MKSDQTIIRKTHMEQLNFITNLLEIKDPNITILDVLDAGTHKKSSRSWIILLLNATAVMVRWLNMTSKKNQKFPI